MPDARDKWNRRYAEKGPAPGEPDPFLVDQLPLLTPGRALDLGAGDGRNSLLLAAHGFAVTAVDISDVALDRIARAAADRGLEVGTLRLDLEAPTPPVEALGSADTIVVFNYKPTAALWSALPRLLSPGGTLLYCTFNLRHHERHGFPERFCVVPGEHRTPPAGLELVHFADLQSDLQERDGYLFRRPA